MTTFETADTDNAARTRALLHPMCLNCWDYLTHRAVPERAPMKDRQYEECCRCGLPTTSGIYRRSFVHLLYCPGHSGGGNGGNDDAGAA